MKYVLKKLQFYVERDLYAFLQFYLTMELARVDIQLMADKHFFQSLRKVLNNLILIICANQVLLITLIKYASINHINYFTFLKYVIVIRTVKVLIHKMKLIIPNAIAFLILMEKNIVKYILQILMLNILIF